VSRIRQGNLRGPQLGDPGREKMPALIAVGINGSVTLIQSGGPVRPIVLERLKKILADKSPNCRLLLDSISTSFSILISDSQPTMADNAAINIDTIAYLVRRTSLEMWTSLLLNPKVLFLGLDKRDRYGILEVVRYLLDKKDIDGFMRTCV